MMTAQSPILNPTALLQLNNSKDSRWLTLEVCREYQRNRCTRTEEECKFAHPPPHVDQQNGRVMCCFDSIKGKCQRKEPPCKYLHPPQHLKEQLLQNGRQNLAIKYHYNQLVQNQLAAQLQASSIIPGLALPNVQIAAPMANPYLYNQYAATGLQAAHLPGLGQLPLQFATMSQGANTTAASAAASLESQALAHIPAATLAANQQAAINGAQKAPRADRLEVCPEFSKNGACPHPDNECEKAHPPEYVLTDDDLAVVCMDFVKGKCTREHCKYYHPTQKLLAKVNQNRAALAAANQASTQAAQQALSQVLAAAIHPSPLHTPQTLIGLAGASSQPVASAAAATLPTGNQAPASMVAAFQGYPAALAGAYQALTTNAAGQMTTISPNRGLQNLAASAVAASSSGPESAISQQTKKRQRDEELMLSVAGVPGVPVPVKRPALDAKSGIPMYPPFVYAPAAAPQPAYVPVSFYGYDMTQHTPSYVVAGHPAGVPRL